MPDLLETIAETDAAVLNGWAAAYKEREPRFNELAENDRARELLILAREFLRRATWAVDTAEGWLSELKLRLRDGMSGDKLRALLTSGRALCGVCRSVTQIADDLWRLVDMPLALIAVGRRLATVEAEIAKLERKTKEPSPEELAAFFQRALERPRSGKWLTPEQARAMIRKAE